MNMHNMFKNHAGGNRRNEIASGGCDTRKEKTNLYDSDSIPKRNHENLWSGTVVPDQCIISREFRF